MNDDNFFKDPLKLNDKLLQLKKEIDQVVEISFENDTSM